MKNILIALIALVLAAPAPTQAASSELPDPLYALELNQYNQKNPTQDDRYTRGSRLLSSKILDSQGRTLGKVIDIRLEKGGSLRALDASLNRMGGHSANLPLDTSIITVKPVEGGGYQLAQNANQLKSLMPQLLANVDVAAGPALSSDIVSVQRLINGGVFSEKGPRIGTIEDVMFSYGGARAQSILVRVDYKTVTGKRVAIPVDSGVFAPGNLYTDMILPSPRAQTLVEFAK